MSFLSTTYNMNRLCLSLTSNQTAVFFLLRRVDWEMFAHFHPNWLCFAGGICYLLGCPQTFFMWRSSSWINQISYELAHIVMFHTWLSAPFLETKSGDQSLKHFQMHSKSPQHSFLSTWAGVSLLFIVYLLLRLIKCWTLFLIWWMFLFLKQHFELKLWLHYF